MGNDAFKETRFGTPQNFYPNEIIPRSVKRKIPVRRQSNSQVFDNFKNKSSEEEKEYWNLKNDNISQVMIHEDMNKARSQDSPILLNLIIRELNKDHMENSENIVLNENSNKNALVLYKEPVNLVNQLIKEATEDDM